MANLGRLAWKHPLVADLGILACKRPLVANLGRLAQKCLLLLIWADWPSIAPWWPIWTDRTGSAPGGLLGHIGVDAPPDG